MARSVQTIYGVIVDEATALATSAGNAPFLAMLANTSLVAVWKIVFYAIAYGIWTVETVFDLFRAEVDETIAKLKPHSLRWYAEKSKAFEYGYNLVLETDYYDNTALTPTQIADSMVIKHAAVTEQTRGIRIKVAVETAGELAMADAGTMIAFSDYIEQIKDAGVKILKSSGNPDDLQATVRVFYNPQVLKADGSRIDGTSATPVQDALNEYLKNLPFNGLFVPQLMVDHLQAVDGVVIIKDDQWLVRYAALPYAVVDVEYTPDAGYLRLIGGGLTITFTPHSVI